MDQKERVAVAPCPNLKCSTPIWSDHGDPWCHKCGEYFPDYFATRLPKLMERRAAVSGQTVGQSPPREVMEQATPRARAIMRRYQDAYRLAKTIMSAGDVAKNVGLGLAVIIGLIGLIAAAELGVSAVVAGILSATGAGLGFWLGGVLLNAQGQLLLASLDQTVGTSPFLTDDEKAGVMSLPTD